MLNVDFLIDAPRFTDSGVAYDAPDGADAQRVFIAAAYNRQHAVSILPAHVTIERVSVAREEDS